MSSFEDFEAELGIDLSDPREALAKELVEADLELLEALVQIRGDREMSKSDVAEAIGRHRSVITNFEKLTSDPHLSTIRRYALAVGARITHVVERVEMPQCVPTHDSIDAGSDDVATAVNVVYANFGAKAQPRVSGGMASSVTATYNPAAAAYSTTATTGASVTVRARAEA